VNYISIKIGFSVDDLRYYRKKMPGLITEGWPTLSIIVYSSVIPTIHPCDASHPMYKLLYFQNQMLFVTFQGKTSTHFFYWENLGKFPGKYWDFNY